MTKAEMRRTLRERRKELRRSVALMRRQARERLESIPAVRRERTKRRVRRAVGLALLASLLLFLRCDGHPAPPPGPPPLGADAGTPEVKAKRPAPPALSKPPPLRAQIPSQPRARYEGETKAPPSWLEEFRIQVAARSPRLAECFKGSDRPGALRWTAAVNAESGAVSDHELEPLGTGSGGWGVMIGSEQRACLLRALSNPPYRLRAPRTAAEKEALPNRVSIVIEF